MRQKVVCVVPEGGSLFEIATPSGVWGDAHLAAAGLDVDFLLCGERTGRPGIDTGIKLAGLDVFASHVDSADMVIVPTWPIADRPASDELSEMLIAAHGSGTRLVGLCLGAFAVAATGLLDGKTAVTHWRLRDRFELLYPQVSFAPDTLYVDHGDVVTSAGSASALDCCLHLVRVDHGAEAAALVARSLVTAPHRSGTQSQFATAPPAEVSDDWLTQALAAATMQIGRVRSVSELAEAAGVNRRSLERHMKARLGVTPREWIADQRLIAACRLLETTTRSVEQVAADAGYGSTTAMRRALADGRQITPTGYRALFQP